MLNPDFAKYSLALVKNDQFVFSSKGQGLKPLWDCLENYRQAKETFILFDKVIGLAAAKLIVYSGIISAVQTLLASLPAKKFLKENGIKIKAQETVTNILTKDRHSICRGEIIAQNTTRQDEFSIKIMAMLEDS